MLVEEAERKMLATSSKKVDEAKKTKDQVEWARLESEERARGMPVLTPVYKYRSLMAERKQDAGNHRGVCGQGGENQRQAVQLV
jgi:hypothetical protein